MQRRPLGKTGLQVSVIGFGAWGIGGAQWIGAREDESVRALHRALDLGMNLVDTALAYGDGTSERLVGRVARERKGGVLVATKVPPKNYVWPASRGVPVSEVFPADHVVRSCETSLRNLGLDTIDLLQLHVWEDDWLDSGELQQTVAELKRDGSIRAFGISLNRWEPWNGVKAVRSGLVDSVQVIYNVFDQAPEDELFPACREHGVAVVARVPFDEGTLTGTLTRDTKWPAGDWRSSYFVPENLESSVARAEALRPLVPAGCTMAEMALRFILSNQDVSTVIPGMRRAANVESNLGASAAGPLPPELIAQLRSHRWDRTPTAWSQ